MKTGKQYVSTGEAARMLGISVSTAQRYFDEGVLSGKKNPITKLRSVSTESVLALMKKYNIRE